MRRLLAATALLALAACAGAPPPPPPPPPAAPRLVATTRGRILVDDGGRGGLPVLFLHGVGADHAAWGELLARVRKDRRAVAIDLPGFGASDAPRGGDVSPPALAEDVGRAADAIGLTRFVLVAHGFSGTIALAYAANHPLRVAGLLFVDADGGHADPTGTNRSAERKAWSAAQFRATLAARAEPMLAGALPSTRERVEATLARTSREALLTAALAAWGTDPVAALARWKGPRLALAPAQRVLLGIQANVEGLPYRKVEGSSHWMMLDQPAEVIAGLDELLAQVK